MVKFFFESSRGEVEPTLIKEGAFLVGTRDPDHHGRTIRHVAEQIFTLGFALTARRVVLTASFAGTKEEQSYQKAGIYNEDYDNDDCHRGDHCFQSVFSWDVKSSRTSE